MFSIFGTGKNRDIAGEDKLVQDVTPSSTPTSLELWTASKVIGRECATVNKEFFICKRDKGDKPSECASEAMLVSECTTQTLSIIKDKFSTEFEGFKSCLDYNDYRFSDCRKQERAFLDGWNNLKGYGKQNEDA